MLGSTPRFLPHQRPNEPVHGLVHVKGFTASDLADRDPVRPHPERIANQVPDGYACRSNRLEADKTLNRKILGPVSLERSPWWERRPTKL